MSETAASHSISVLVADDEPAVLDAYRTTLDDTRPKLGPAMRDLQRRLFSSPEHAQSVVSQASFTTRYVRGAQEAVDAVRQACEAQTPFSVVFLDMRMPPGPDGMWAAQQIRSVDPFVDIVICTAYSDVNPYEFAVRAPPADKIFFLQKPFHPHEIRQFALALGRKRQAEQRLHKLAYFDALTGLPNRESFRMALEAALQTARNSEHSLAVLYLDLDNFKQINDALGHSAGDKLLCSVSALLRQVLRSNDIMSPAGVLRQGERGVARLGGDEFVIILPRIQRREEAAVVAERIGQTLSVPIQVDFCEVQATPSIGIAMFPQDGADADTLFKHADLAMYHSKRGAAGGYTFFENSMTETSLRRLALEGLLRHALARKQLVLHFQPQINLNGSQSYGMEALLRWNCPEVGLVSPAEIIPIAESNGLIIPIGEWVLREACLQAQEWRRQGLPLRSVSVNVSPRQFVRSGFSALVSRILAETGLPPSCLDIEITEGLLINDEAMASRTMAQLDALGVSVSIDDFGTGYAGLSRLKQLNVRRLKIDRAFVKGLPSSRQDAAIVSAVIQMAHDLGMEVVAEGVEEGPQLQFLRDQNCGEAQGFLLSRPLPVADATRFLQDKSGIQPDPSGATALQINARV